MNANLVRAAVARFGDDPDGIGRFRKVVIGLAIAGKLTGGARALSPAAINDLIEQEKIRLASDGQIPHPKRYAAVTDEQLPEVFSDPSLFVPLGTIARIEKGVTGIQSAISGSFPLVVTAAERSSCDHFDFEGAATIVPLVSSTGHGNASINRLHYQEGKFALGTILAAIFPYAPDLISARFIFEYLSTFKDELLVPRMTGTANVTLSVGRIAEVPIPLICPGVQRKADELMALCDQLEAARAEREAVRDTFTLSTLAKLDTPDSEAFGADARFALANLAPLTTRPDQIKQLRQTILRLGLAGRLTEQNPADDPASDLLATIDARRSALLKSGYPNASEARTQSRKVAEQSLPSKLSDLPHGWEYATLQQCALMVIDCKNKTAPYTQSGVRLVRTTNVRDGKLNAIDQRYVSPETYEVWSARGKPEPGDILITREAPMGEVCLVPTDTTICLGQRMMLARLVPDTISPGFMLYSLMDPDLMDRVQDKPIGMTVQHLRVGGVETLVVPLPPLAEQHRIVAKVDDLMALCDQLEASITTGEQARSRLLEAVLHQSLEPA
ncbi:type I restriction enzyme S subunit [Novosphingobium chloroacetimidivorans]|uniref:Type I restriction enzyme S subunit n=1 Tax=Novosphingobium chloroacetimidivorans TaxID=1428314 RepID=A0A7W7K779_9SPHN|nr:restriction endonuclease subunit S [Novosphingobium chloroacetimidivorans]MBB4857161.1 type I restriction enzyme S subunit [Novosphingobium chloroacetimidivorans]